MSRFTGFRLVATVANAMMAAFLAILIFGVGEAAATDLSVYPKNEKTLFYSSDDKLAPRAVKYKLKATDGRKVSWKLKRYPKWLVPEATSGKAKRKWAKLRFTADKTVIGRLNPGIYKKVIQFRYGSKKTGKTIRRNVTLIVEGDPTEGRDVFVAKCSGCHDLYVNMSGPYLWNVYGRKAGTANGFDHSDALIAYGEIWEERNLDAWLKNTQRLVPRAKMYFRLKSRSDRMNIIAYLKSVSP